MARSFPVNMRRSWTPAVWEWSEGKTIVETTEVSTGVSRFLSEHYQRGISRMLEWRTSDTPRTQESHVDPHLLCETWSHVKAEGRIILPQMKIWGRISKQVSLLCWKALVRGVGNWWLNLLHTSYSSPRVQSDSSR